MRQSDLPLSGRREPPLPALAAGGLRLEARPLPFGTADRHSGRDARQAGLVGDRFGESLAVGEEAGEAAAPVALERAAADLDDSMSFFPWRDGPLAGWE